MWQVEFTRKAQKQFAKLDRETQQLMVRHLDRIIEAGDPFQFGKPLVGEFSGYWRYRVGKYRMICDVQKRRLIIEIIAIAKRDKVYGGL